MQKKKLLMSDCYGVISTTVLPPFFVKHFGPEKGLEMEKYYCPRGDRGEITLFDIAKDMEEKYHLGKAEDLCRDWIENTVANHELVDFYQTLRGEYEVVVASNAAKGLVEETFQKHHLEDKFDRIFISYKMGVIKPSKEFYLRIINSYEEKFDEMYMVDDRASNFVELSSIGVKGILYTSVKDLKKALGKS